jgi:hypothetical protein
MSRNCAGHQRHLPFYYLIQLELLRFGADGAACSVRSEDRIG